MLLVVDIGNTNITMGVFGGHNLNAKFRITTKIIRTSDEYGLIICDLLKIRNIKLDSIEDVVISSVVPAVMHSFENAIVKYLNRRPINVGPGTRTGIKMVTGNAKEIGADRIVDAVGAYNIYGGPVIVIDYGTATTYDYITENGAFAAGVTSPGIRICAKALWQDAAKLPEIEIKKPDSILAQNTVTSMQAGLVFGHIGESEYIIRKIKEETGAQNIKVVATGGLGKIIYESSKEIDIYDEDLTLKGLEIIYQKERANKK